MITYAAYLRVYEPVSAFPEPGRSRWADYAASPARPRRRDSLRAEHAEALRRAVTTPPVAVPERESEHAYVRRVDGITYVCPWQTRLRCLLAYSRTVSAAGAPLPGVALPGVALPDVTLPDVVLPDAVLPDAVPAGDDDQATAALARSDDAGPGDLSARLHILASVWTVPLAWFVPFSATDRWLSLGPGRGQSAAAATAPSPRALVYTTPMPRARQRVASSLATLRSLPPGSGDAAWKPRRAAGELAAGELADVSRWLEEFHPHSLVELDYGGLVHLVSDDALCGDQSAAEIGAAIDGVARGEREFAVAMYRRARHRWRALAGLELAN